MEETKKQPIKKFKAGGVTATIWENDVEVEGRTFKKQTVAIERSYKKGDDWQVTNSYNVQDLMKLKLVVEKAYEFLSLSPEVKEE